MDTILYIVIPLAIGFALGRRHFRSYAFQNRSEAQLSRVTREHFHPPDYRLMNHVTLQMGNGTTQVDHILVSRFGVFVVEAKDHKSWIFANAKQASWTQVLFNGKFEFQNPIFQNLLHVRAVQELLDFLPLGVIKSAVVFMGKAEFKTDIPDGVFTLSWFIDHIHNKEAKLCLSIEFNSV